MFKRPLSLTVIFCFFLTTLGPLPQAHADTILGLPQPGSMINLSPAFEPVLIKGLKVHPDNPLSLDFIVDTGDSRISAPDPRLKIESEKMIKYFFAALTLPEKDVWVNLSPYEKDRIVPVDTGDTEMGRDMLAQDYMLKQITASLIYPEKGLGKDFWDRIYRQAYERFGTTQIPVNTFNKVWIVADKASVYENTDTVLVVDTHLKVMLEEDYLALQKQLPLTPLYKKEGGNGVIPPLFYKEGLGGSSVNINALGSQIIREIILPALEKEVNQGKNFANLRQIFHSLVLAKWYKETLKTALLNQVYSNKAKIVGVDVADKNVKEEIYQQYLRAYKKGVFNFIKEDIDQTTQQPLPRKYFSGGLELLKGLRIERAQATRSALSSARFIGLTFLVGILATMGTAQGQNSLSPTTPNKVKVNVGNAAMIDGITPQAAFGVLDLTILEPPDNRKERWEQRLVGLAKRAIAEGTGGICVWWDQVHIIEPYLRGKNIKIAAVVAFPKGLGEENGASEEAAREQAKVAIDAGADELDVVINHPAIKDGRTGQAREEVEEFIAYAKAYGKLKQREIVIKTILEVAAYENPALHKSQLQTAIDIAIENSENGDFIKTSSGFYEVGGKAKGANLEDSRQMLESIAQHYRETGGKVLLGFKPAGGIKFWDNPNAPKDQNAKEYMELAYSIMLPVLGPAGALDYVTNPNTFRIGASSLPDDLAKYNTSRLLAEKLIAARRANQVIDLNNITEQFGTPLGFESQHEYWSYNDAKPNRGDIFVSGVNLFVFKGTYNSDFPLHTGSLISVYRFQDGTKVFDITNAAMKSEPRGSAKIPVEQKIIAALNSRGLGFVHFDTPPVILEVPKGKNLISVKYRNGKYKVDVGIRQANIEINSIPGDASKERFLDFLVSGRHVPSFSMHLPDEGTVLADPENGYLAVQFGTAVIYYKILGRKTISQVGRGTYGNSEKDMSYHFRRFILSKIPKSDSEAAMKTAINAFSIHQAVNPNDGGIDFNASKIGLQRMGQLSQIKFNQAMMAQFEGGNFTGIKPVVTSIRQIYTVLPLFGFTGPQENIRLARA